MHRHHPPIQLIAQLDALRGHHGAEGVDLLAQLPNLDRDRMHGFRRLRQRGDKGEHPANLQHFEADQRSQNQDAGGDSDNPAAAHGAFLHWLAFRR